MTYGFRSTNDDEIVQIDEDFQSIEVVSSGNGVASTSYPAGLPGEVTFPAQDYPPLIFVTAAAGVVVGQVKICGEEVLPNVFLPGPPYLGFTYVANGNFSYKVCGLSNTPSVTGNHGLRVFDEVGVETYDSRRTYAQIKSVDTFSAQASPAYVSITVPDQGAAPWFFTNSLVLNPFYGEEGPFRFIACNIVNNTTVQVSCLDGVTGNYYTGGSAPYSTNDFDVPFSPGVMMTAKF